MSVAPEIPREEYLGTDSADTYTYNFEISKPDELLVYVETDEGVVSKLEANTDYLILGIDESGIDIDPLIGDDDGGPTGVGDINGGKIKLLAGNLPADYKLVILRILDIEQPIPFRENRTYFARTHESAFDRSIKIDQQQQIQIDRSLKVGPTISADDFSTELPTPEPGKMVVVNADATAFALRSFDQMAAEAGSGLPPGGDEHALLEKKSNVDADADWSAPAVFSGYSSRLGEFVNESGVIAALTKLFGISYTPPLISLSGSSNVLREKGDTVSGITLTASLTKRSDPIAEVRFYRNPSTLLDTQTSGGAIPNGGNSTYNYATPFSDTVTFRAEADDDGTSGGPTTVQATTTYNFVYPYYVGAGSPGLSAASVAALTKRIIQDTANRTETIAASGGNVFYFAYPASYGALTSILDVNNFETIGDWTLRTENITGLDASAQSYRIYEFNNPVTAGSYQYTFKR